MKRFFYLLSLICVLTACEDISQIDNSLAREEYSSSLKLTLNIDSLSTRGVISGSMLPSGSEVGVYVTDVDNSGYYMGEEYTNVRYTVNGSDLVKPDQEIMLAPSEALLYAYFPYHVGADISSLDINTASQIDYMYAQPVSGLRFDNANAALTMNHAMAVLSLNIVKGSYSGACNVSEVSVKGSTLATSGSYNGKTGEIIDREGFNNFISCSEGGFTLNMSGTQRNIILIPSTSEETLHVSIVVDGVSRTIEIPSFIAKQAYRHSYTLTVNEEELVVSDVSINTWENANSEYNVYITGDTQDIGINWQINEDGSITVIAIPAIMGESVKEVSCSDGFDITQSVDEYSGLRTLLLTNIKNDVYLSFNGITQSSFVYNINTSGSGTFKVINSQVDLSIIKSMSVDGEYITPSHTASFSSAGDHCVRIYFNDGITTIPNSFCSYLNAVGKVIIPDSISSIGTYSFCSCSITSIDIPEGVISIGKGAFQDCSKLISINLPNSITSISEDLFYGCSSLSYIELPKGIVEIKSYAFRGCALTSIEIPEGVSKISVGTFFGCSKLKSITLCDNINTIDSYAFKNCSQLTSINLHDKITSIDDEAFRYCISLKSIDLPTSITEVSDYLFYGCTSLESVTMPENVKSIGRCAFSGCGFTSLPSLPNNLQEIGGSAFSDCKFTQLNLPSCISSITLGGNLFANCKALKKVVFSNSASTFALPEYIFSGCTSLADVSLTPNISGFFEGAFYNCINLKEINIPASVSYFGNYVFGNCNNLTKITYNRLECPNSASLSIAMFYNQNNQHISSFTLYVPKGAKNFDNWLYLGPDVTIVYF